MISGLFRFLDRFFWLLIILATFLLYAMGGGIARCLGAPFDVGIYWLGQFWVITFQLSVYLLDRYFDFQSSVENMGRELFPGLSYRSGILLGAAIFMTVSASLTVLLIRSGRLTPPVFTFVVLGVVGAIFYAVPPIRLATSGFGELTLSILLGILIPGFAFLLQFGELHRIVAMATFPIAFLLLALNLALGLPTYTAQIKYKKRTLLIRVGWETAMTLHNILILGAFLWRGLATVLGFPTFAVFPALLTLPLGLLQIWYVNRIANGATPNWIALSVSAVVLFGSMAYILTFSFWTH